MAELFFLLGTKGRNKGEFTNLQGVAASSQGNVLIADSNNQCVQVKIILNVLLILMFSEDVDGFF